MRSAGTPVFSSNSAFNPLTPLASTKEMTRLSLPHLTVIAMLSVLMVDAVLISAADYVRSDAKDGRSGMLWGRRRNDVCECFSNRYTS